MNLPTQLQAAYSKTNCLIVVDWIGSDQKRFDKLFEIFTGDDPRLAQLASWPLSYVIENHPSLIKKHLKKLLQTLDKPGIHDGVKRSSIRLLQFVEIPEKFQGSIMDLCFRYIANPAEKAAAKAYAITVLWNLSKLYPEIRQELKTIIEERWNHEGPAFKARAREFLKYYNRLPRN